MTTENLIPEGTYGLTSHRFTAEVTLDGAEQARTTARRIAALVDAATAEIKALDITGLVVDHAGDKLTRGFADAVLREFMATEVRAPIATALIQLASAIAPHARLQDSWATGADVLRGAAKTAYDADLDAHNARLEAEHTARKAKQAAEQAKFKAEMEEVRAKYLAARDGHKAAVEGATAAAVDVGATIRKVQAEHQAKANTAGLELVCDRVEGVGGFTDPKTGAWIPTITEHKPGTPRRGTLIGDGAGKMYALPKRKAKSAA